MANSNDPVAISEQELLSIRRAEIPASNELQKRILMETSDLLQNVPSEQVVGKHLSFLSKARTPLAVSFALAASIAMAVVIWLPSNEINSVPGSDPNILSATELEFRDTLLLQDELLFADL